MSVRVITGPPGAGKTLNLTYFAIQAFKNNNTRLDLKSNNNVYVNNVYSNYPILLKKSKNKFNVESNGELYSSIPIKRYYNKEMKKYYYQECLEEDRECYGVFSNKIIFTDMRLKYKFTPNASFFIDELQYIYDSMEYKDFPDCIAHFFQIHRHLGYNDIYTNSQSLSRVIKRVLCVSEEFLNIIENKKCFFGLYWRVDFAITTNINFSKNIENDYSDNPNIDYERIRYFCNKVNNSYLTKYLGALNNGLPYYNLGQFNSLLMYKPDILKSFMISSNVKEELKNQLF